MRKKIIMLGENKYKWKKIDEDDVVKWVGEKIPEWNETQPKWWNAQKKASVPDWVVRDPSTLRSIRTKDVIAQQRRKSSITSTEKSNEAPANSDTLRRRLIATTAHHNHAEIIY